MSTIFTYLNQILIDTNCHLENYSLSFNQDDYFLTGYYPSDSCYPHSSTMVQPIPKSCVITSPIPIHVPHAEVKVLIHNPHPSQPFIQTADSPKLKKSRRGSQQTIPKTKTVDNQQKNNSKRKTDIFKSKPKLGKRNCDLNVISEKVEKSYSPSKRKKPNSSNCGWSWEGEPEMKPVLSLVSKILFFLGKKNATKIY